MGAFVLGVLVGWLAEWVFFTFWIKGRSSGKFADCSKFESELSAKNSEIATLKADLDAAKQVNASAATIKDSVKATKTTKSTASSAAKKTDDNKSSKTSKTAKTATKAASKATPAKSSKAKKAAPKAKGKAVKKTTTAKKSPAKKAAKPAVAKTKKRAVKAKGDDFTQLTGVGPSMAAKIKGIGVSSFKELAAMDDDDLREKLEATGARLNTNKEAMDTWNEQALLAEKGDFDGLKKFQEALKK